MSNNICLCEHLDAVKAVQTLADYCKRNRMTNLSCDGCVLYVNNYCTLGDDCPLDLNKELVSARYDKILLQTIGDKIASTNKE